MKTDLTNQRFGRLLVTGLAAVINRLARWNCTCDCGATKIVQTAKLKNGHTRSCGCLRRETARDTMITHGGSKSITYKRWRSMRARCMLPNTKSYPIYGGRGIAVCSQWINSFETFLLDMGECPGDEWTIERNDGDGNYEPSNCRWATRTEQNRNTSRTRFVEIDGVSKSLAEWCELRGLTYNLVHHRLSAGKSVLEALEVSK